MVKYKRGPDQDFPFKKSDYKFEEPEDLYKPIDREERPLFEEKPLPPEKVVKQIVIRREAMPRQEDMVIKPLKLIGEEVIGSIFDRVDFLKQRIDELTEALNVRDQVHKSIADEIEADIRMKEAMALKVVDFDEKRNMRLDISNLRREKRLESVQYWRDETELRSELREFMEKFETEKKIVDIFKQVGGEQPEKEAELPFSQTAKEGTL